VLNAGANAFVDSAPKRVSADEYEVESTALLMYAGTNPPGHDGSKVRTCAVTSIIEPSPASIGGLKPGDRFVSIGGRAVEGSALCDDAIGKLEGVRRGERVEVKILRGTETVEVTLERPIEGLYGFHALEVPAT
jgi:S1-C subfamily serine protease